MIKKLVFIFFAFICLMAKADNSYIFKTWDMSHGLSDNTVKCIGQDKYGFLWLGTFNGLCRFDGQRFTVFRHVANDAHSLINNEISSLACTDKGIWVGTSAGPVFYSFSDNRFYPCYTGNGRQRLTTGVKNLLADNGIALVLDMEGSLYVQARGCSFNVFKSPEKWYSIAHFKGHLYWAHAASGLYLLDISKGSVALHYPYPVKGSSEIIYYSQNQNRLYIGAGLDGTTDVFTVNGMKVQKIEQQAPEHIKSVLDYGDETLFGTDGGGLICLKKGRYISLVPVNSTISSDAVFSLFKDRQGNLLVGTYRGGLDVFSPQQNLFRSLTLAGGKLTQNVVTAVYKENTKIYIGLDGGGLNIYDTQTGRTQSFNRDNSPLPGNNLLSITGDEENIWLGFYKGGLCRYSLSSGAFTPFPLPLHDVYLWNIRDDGKGYIWVAGQNTYRLNKTTLKYEEVPVLHGAGASDICFDSNAVWVSTTRGIYKLNETGRLLRHFASPVAGADSPTDKIRFMYIDSKHRKWIATDEPALYIMDRDENKPRWRRVKNDISRQKIVGIEEEKPDIFWIATFNGLFRYDERTGAFVQFTKNDRLPSAQFNYNSSWQDGEGMMYWGTTGGLVYFNSHEIQFPTTELPVNFTNVQLTDENNTTISLLGDVRKEVCLPYNKNFFTINFSVPDITYSDKIRYAYCMKHFDEQWRYVDRPSAAYTSLPPGEYDFCVKSTNASGQWGDTVTTLHIVITPPWWKTWWAMTLWYILIGVALYLAFRLYLHELQIKHSLHIQKIEREADERINRSKMDFLVNIVHELRTPVFLIAAPLEELMSSGKRIVQAPLSYMQGIYGNVQRLNTLINRIIDFRKIESGALRLQLKHFDAVAYCRDLSVNYKNLCKQKNITFTYESGQPFIPLWADPSKLDSILSNLISNAFKYTPEGGSVWLSVSERDDNVVFSVKDNGIGIAPAHQKTIFTDFYQVNAAASPIPGDGIGLSFVKRLVELHGGTVTVKSQENEGAEFIFTIPLRQETPTGHTSELSAESLKTLPKEEENVVSKKELTSPVTIHTVLIIDDDAETIDLLEDYLKEDFTVYRASNGKEGLQKTHEVLPDIIITDLMMPQMDGLAFLSSLKQDKMLSSIPVIVLTGDTSEESKLSVFKNGGVEAYMTKPVSLRYLRERMDYVMTQSEIRHLTPEALFPQRKYNKEEQRFILQCREIIDEHLADITVKSLAEALGMSQSPLYKRMKELTGLSVIEFIINYRIFKAIQYFKQGETNIGDVCTKCGFNDPKNFREVFKRKMNMTPRDFIKSL